MNDWRQIFSWITRPLAKGSRVRVIASPELLNDIYVPEEYVGQEGEIVFDDTTDDTIEEVHPEYGKDTFMVVFKNGYSWHFPKNAVNKFLRVI